MARGMETLLPGLRSLLRGSWLAGASALGLWCALWALVVFRFPRILAAPSGGVDDRVAVLTLLLALLALWTWAWLGEGGRRPGGVERGVGGEWDRGWEAFRENRMAVAGLWIVGGAYLMAALTPLVAPYDPTYQPAYQAGESWLILAPPSGSHFMGTDHLSRDVFSRVLYGARISLSIGFLAVGVSVTLGTVLGAVAGYVGGWVDTLVMRLADMVMAFPRLVLLIALVALFQPSIFLIIMALGFTHWPFTTRVVRGEMLSLREREFADAARALGFSRTRIIFRHLLPNALAPVIVTATLGIGNTIVLEAGLSFLGLGVQPPTPSWGMEVAAGRGYLPGAWWISTFPGLAIVLVVMAFNLVGDGLRDALDPRQKRRPRP